MRKQVAVEQHLMMMIKIANFLLLLDAEKKMAKFHGTFRVSIHFTFHRNMNKQTNNSI